MKPRELIDLANRKVDIKLVCKLIGMDLPSSSMKTYCPFGFFHSDGGRQRTFKITENHAYCYRCNQVYDPVRLLATANDIKQVEAAKQLLDEIDYQPTTFTQRWEQAQIEARPPDRGALGLALRVYCNTADVKWDERQFEDRIAQKLDQCLSLLTKVNTDEEAREWLEATKKIMKIELGKGA